jgi:hypothetical protein
MPLFRKKPVVIEAHLLGEDYDQDCEILKRTSARPVERLVCVKNCAACADLENACGDCAACLAERR